MSIWVFIVIIILLPLLIWLLGIYGFFIWLVILIAGATGNIKTGFEKKDKK